MRNDKKRKDILYNMAIEALLESQDRDIDTVGSIDKMAHHIVECWIDTFDITFYGKQYRMKQRIEHINNIDNKLIIHEKSTGYVRRKGESKPPNRNTRLDS